jgi:hypothetical protein
MRNAAAKRNEMVHTIWEWDLGEAWGLFPSDRDMAGQDPLPELMRRAATIHALTGDLTHPIRDAGSRGVSTGVC